MIQRRYPGTRRRRLRRMDELEVLRATDPARAEALEALRAANPQEYRKELRRLYRRGVLVKGRGYEVPDEALALLDGPLDALRAAVEQGLADGDYGFRTVGGLLQAEQAGRRRPEVLAWLGERYEALLDQQNRALR